MTANEILSDCKFCSIVSKTNGEDPIGSAGPRQQWLVMEVPQPWPAGFWQENPQLQPIAQTAQTIYEEQNHFPRLLAIAPDHQYSQPNVTRILYLQRPQGLFATLERHEYLVPQAEMSDVAIALLTQSEQLSQFATYHQDTQPKRDLLVCTHGNVDVACARFGHPIYKQLREDYAGDTLRVWRCSHFGGHQFAPTLIDLPEGRYWGHLEPDILDLLVRREGSVTGLRPYYRGCAGLTQFEQIVEREIWMREGWDWLNYHKAGQILAKDETNEDADWAEVRIDFASSNGTVSGAYEARVEVSHRVTTMWQSGDEESIATVKQYQVSRLVKRDGDAGLHSRHLARSKL
ncbi:MAG: sucrase ferredoxin [Leptolyngbya sp. SIO4C5]|nr:sucrase ferredoxin [Leptolyngbya sp. SIO4C5]